MKSTLTRNAPTINITKALSDFWVDNDSFRSSSCPVFYELLLIIDA